jgi:hypothetical protein
VIQSSVTDEQHNQGAREKEAAIAGAPLAMKMADAFVGYVIVTPEEIWGFRVLARWLECGCFLKSTNGSHRKRY